MSYVLRDTQGVEYAISSIVQIGQDATNQIVLNDPLISRHHLTVWPEGGALNLRDDGSANGTSVNGARIQAVTLRPNDQILIGNTLLVVIYRPDTPAPSDGSPGMTVIQPGGLAPHSHPPQPQPPVAQPYPPHTHPPPPAYPPPHAHGPSQGYAPQPVYPQQPLQVYPQGDPTGRMPVAQQSPQPGYGPAAQARPPAPPPPAKGRAGCGRLFVLGCLLPLFACVLLSGGGYLAFRTGIITPNQVLNVVGLGPASIEINNLRDDTITVSFTQLDAPKDSSPNRSSVTLKSFDVRSLQITNSGRFRVDFTASAGGASLGTCTLSIRGGAKYQFVALPARVLINMPDSPPARSADLTVSTSSLCR